LIVPATLVVVTFAAACAPPAPVTDSASGDASDAAACVPWSPGAVQPPAANTRPVVDIAPCPPSMPGPATASCRTAAGCDVVYDAASGAQMLASFVSCRVTDSRCLVTFDATGAPVFVPCPTFDLPNASCINNFALQQVALSNFSCGANAPCEAMGTPGMRSAFAQRSVDGTYTAPSCPSECLPLV
jgi:hypothetical protein